MSLSPFYVGLQFAALLCEFLPSQVKWQLSTWLHNVRYLTADGQEAILTEEAADQVTIGQSVNSKDIQKAGQIYTNTPRGGLILAKSDFGKNEILYLR